MMNKSNKYQRYQDYVIRDGKLIGEFEEMYCDFEDPWEQSTHEPEALDKLIGLSLLRKYGHQRALEYGCGLGHFTAKLQSELGAAAGVDISPTAIDKARMRFPELTFFVGDLLDDNPIVKFAPDVLVLAEITWYVLESLPSFKRLLIDKCGGSAILHILTVYPLGQQRYGKEYFTNLDEIMKFWSDTVEMKEWGWVSREGADGTGRTFFYGTIREPGI